MERACVGGLLVRRQEDLSILLARRSGNRAFFPNVWDVPGGHCERRETPEQALVRELDEELGVVPKTWRLLGELGLAATGPDEPLLLYLYEVTGWIGTPHNRMPAEHAEVCWLTIGDACQLPLAHPGYPALFHGLK